MTKAAHTQIHCPKCGTVIDVQSILARELEEEIRNKYSAESEKQRLEFESKQAQLRREQLQMEEYKRQEKEIFNQKLQESLKLEREKIIQQEQAKLKDEQAAMLAQLEKELKEKSEQVKELNLTKAEIARLNREKDELKSNIEAETQVKLNETLNQEREKIRLAEAEKSELKMKELQKQLEDQKKLTEEMKRKQEQGSMQLQGEVQELAIEEWLMAKFPLDTIEEIKKGARGGDCIQIVNTRTRQNCGKIYYESKRTKEYQSGWIEKFRADMREKGADVGVLVTEAMPSDMERMGMVDGVWICTFSEFKGLCGVLRETVIQLDAAVSSQENKGDKMEMMYNFLTSNTFRMQVEAIVEAFRSLKDGLESEKRAMMRIWKEREKQLEKVIENTIDMHGSIKGIAGNAVQSVRALELPGQEFLDAETD
ncbi:MAG: DUF2130 domain-containing protein [Bacteroidetes bacterium]|nr:DUF2130 domain-containing protein [Bacteroidota bacterium]